MDGSCEVLEFVKTLEVLGVTRGGDLAQDELGPRHQAW